ncbi:MAG: hypothetical protein C5B46_07100 [Proteobacteria bacterium]|nr:MAG: hypothetical protein C5B46_07100 [Pseudomonadota bacterium]
MVLVAVSFAISGCGKEKAPPKPPPAVQAHQPAPKIIAGADEYRRGKSLLTEGRETDALRLLEQSVRANSKLTEAWYELGRIKVKRAPELSKSDEQAGVVMFREGLEAEKEALRLIDAGATVFWSEDDRVQAREQLDTDLANAGDALNDEDTLRQALRMRVH